jgi:hypothetical protein
MTAARPRNAVNMDASLVKAFHTFGYLNLESWFAADEIAVLGAVFDDLIARTGDGPLGANEIGSADPLVNAHPK